MEQSYKEKYEDILARLERAKNDNFVCDERYCCVIDDLIPELAESEDEKVREDIISLVNEFWERIGSINPEYSSRSRMLAWLEKQGDYANFRDKAQVGDRITKNEDGIFVNLSQMNRVAKKNEKQGEQKPANWSEEDERNLQGIIDEIEANKNQAPDYDLATYDRFLSWLKSLRPQNNWKPSELQLECLSDAIEHYNSLGYPASKLKELLNDLKKLKGEV